MPITITGDVIDAATGNGAVGLRVETWDKDPGTDDFLGYTLTDAQGRFMISISEIAWWELFFDFWPDLYFKVFSNGVEILNTSDSIMWNVRKPVHVSLPVTLPCDQETWIERDIYLKIEQIEDYSPVQPMDKVPPPIDYGRDCMQFSGHPGGVIPDAEIDARAMTAVTYREYKDPGYLFPMTYKLIDADINEPNFNHRVPGTVIYVHPSQRIRIHVWNCDKMPRSFHTHGLHYGISSDGAWPFGTENEAGQRSDEICPGQSWIYEYEVTDEMIGAWPFHSHVRHVSEGTNRGLFGGIVVLARNEPLPKKPRLPKNFFNILKKDLKRLQGKRPLHVKALVPQAKVLLRDQLNFLDEYAIADLIKPRPRPPTTDHVPVFFHQMSTNENKPLFTSGDIPELGGFWEHTFNEEGMFDYFCEFHPTMTATVHVVAAGAMNVTVNIIDGPPMGFSPPMVMVGIGGVVRWENLSMSHHTVTSSEGANMPTHCINGRGFVGNSPTIIARSGQRIRWYVFNLDFSMNWHNFHPHAQRWNFGGEALDIRSIGPAESFVVETEAPPVILLTNEMRKIQDPKCRPKKAKRYHLKGEYVFHCHVHHHLMNGMVGIVRAKQTLWLTDKMVDNLRKTTGFPEDDGLNACPVVDPERCKKRGQGVWEVIAGDPQVTFMHSVLLPQTDKVLYWGYTRADQSRLWDYSTDPGVYSAPANQPAMLPGHDANTSDLWSAEHAILDTPEGTVLANGGFTPNRAFVFDPPTEIWSEVQQTAHNRFYSTTLLDGSGKALTLFGSASKSIETYTHGVGWSAPTLMPADYNHHVYYPWTYLLPDGKLFIAGPHMPTQRFDPANPAVFDSFATIGGNRSTGGEKATSVLQILRPPQYRPIVLIAGGNTAGTEKTAEQIDLAEPAPIWTALPDLNVARAQQFTSVLMPDGRVFIAGGVLGADGGPCEIYDPKDPVGGWELGPVMDYARIYHSSIILLADGSILAGGDPSSGGLPTPHERYYPDYFTVPRPVIDNAPATINYANSMTIDTSEAADISEVVLLRAGAVTHGFNMAQRGIELEITATAANSIVVDTPPTSNLCPPGWHLLFILNTSRTPSKGRWIRLTT